MPRLFGRQDREVSRFEAANAELADVTTRQQVIGQAFFTVVGAFLGATPIIVYLVVGLLIEGGTGISAGTVVAFTTLQTRLFFPVARLLETWVELQSSQAMFERIFAYLDTKPDVVEAASPDGVDSGGLRGPVGLRAGALHVSGKRRLGSRRAARCVVFGPPR